MTAKSTFDPDRTEKVCSRCRRLLPIDTFNRDRRRADGHQAYCRRCKAFLSAQALDTPAWRARRREVNRQKHGQAKALLARLKAHPCMDCGGVFPPYVMHFDHRDPTLKRHEVSYWVSCGAISQLLEEVAHCDLVCANCHALRTHRQREAGIIKFGRPRFA